MLCKIHCSPPIVTRYSDSSIFNRPVPYRNKKEGRGREEEREGRGKEIGGGRGTEGEGEMAARGGDE